MYSTSQELSRALLIAYQLGGGTIMLHAGVIVVTAPLLMWGNCTLAGAGVGQTTLVVPKEFPLTAPGVIAFPTGQGERRATIRDLTIEFEQPDTAKRWELIPYPPAIFAVDTPRVMIQRVRIIRAWDAINLTGNSGGAVLDDIEFSSFHIGIHIDGSIDSVRLEKVHCWPFGITPAQFEAAMDRNSVGLLVGRVDDLHVSNCLWLTGTGVHLYPSQGVPWVEFTSNTFDGKNGLKMEAGYATFASSWFGLSDPRTTSIFQTGGHLTVGSSQLRVSCHLDGAAFECAGGTLVLTGSTLDTEAYETETVKVSGGTAIISSNLFLRQPNVAYSRPTLYAAGGRLSAHGNRCSDKGSGSGDFLVLDTDDHHSVMHNVVMGWDIKPPSGRVNTVLRGNVYPVGDGPAGRAAHEGEEL